MKSPSLSPREFLKSRRPEESSDSVHESREEIDRPHLEYHLDQLTSRRQETPFENFSRRLCEREICPNLIPQTGPVGGGDSKVDSETYPVSKQIVASWYVGDPDSAAGDRWAFAFSAKKKWLEKARSDIKGIHETARGYKKAFFVTNQFVRDKKRAEVEGELSRLYGMDVRIFDRTWILDKVFAKRHEDLVFDELGLELQSRDHFKLGLEDASKTDRLNAYEREISQCVANGKLDLLLVDHCLEAAILSRNLEKAREETEGRFLRARRNAEAFGTRHQQLLVEYQLAWTAFWYFEDADQFNEQFDRVLRFASGSDNSYDFELVNNLYSCLWMIFRTAKVSPDKLSMRERTREIQKNLGRLQSLVDRPSAALHARALALHVKLLNSDPQAAGEVFRDFRSLIESSEGHVGFPFARLTAVLCEIGKFFIGNREYDSLYESMSSLTSAREGETKGAELLVKRGEHLMAASEHAEAVRVLGRALRHLYRDETRNELIYALHMLSVAHQELGLLWAARGYCLMAGTLAMDELWKHSDVTRLQAAMLERMKWLELELGRLPVALAWHEADLAWKHLLPERDNDEGREEDDVMFSGCLGILFLNAELWDLKWLRQLPGTLDSLGLFEASLALRFALGGDVAPELSLTESQATPTDFFRMWRDQPASERLPRKISLHREQRVEMDSWVIGCRVEVSCENEVGCVLVAEWILASLEAFLATGIADQVIALESVVKISVDLDCSLDQLTSQRSKDLSTVSFSVACPDVVSCISPEWVNKQSDVLVKLLTEIVACAFYMTDLPGGLEQLIGAERGLERAVSFTGFGPQLFNVLGHSPKVHLSNWISPSFEEHELTRSEDWDLSERQTLVSPKPPMPSDSGPSPSELPPAPRHDQWETINPIREQLWREARWNAMLLLWGNSQDALPILALGFENHLPAEAIFRQWREQFGHEDHEGRLRISVIRGFSRSHPHWYRIVIGANPEAWIRRRGVSRVMMASRVHEMTPATGDNLDNFLRKYAESGSYLLSFATPADLASSNGQRAIQRRAIRKSGLIVRHAWEVGLNDFDVVAIHADDDPVLPEGTVEAPVTEVLVRKRSKTDA